MNLELESRHEHGVEIVGVRGELDLTNTSVLADALEGIERSDIVLDLSVLMFIDSAGLHTIDAARRRLEGAGRRLVVVAPPDSRADWTFRVAAFAGDFVVGSVEAALGNLSARV